MTVIIPPNGAIRLAPLGRCMYCQEIKDLSMEHIVPLSFGGRLKFPAASCKSCQEKTSQIEDYCARQIYGKFRNKMGFPTRHPQKRPITLPLKQFINGKWGTTDVPASDTAILLPLVEFLIPGLFRNSQVREVGWEGVTIHAIGLGSNGIHAGFQYGMEEDLVFNINIDKLARMLAKIAHGMSVAQFGIDSFEHWLPPYILGDDPTLSYVVGSIPEQIEKHLEPSNACCSATATIIPLNSGGFVLCQQIWLFGKYGSPAFVAVGKTRPDFKIEDYL